MVIGTALMAAHLHFDHEGPAHHNFSAHHDSHIHHDSHAHHDSHKHDDQDGRVLDDCVLCYAMVFSDGKITFEFGSFAYPASWITGNYTLLEFLFFHRRGAMRVFARAPPLFVS